MSQPTPPARGAAAPGKAGFLGSLPLLPVVAVGALLVAGGAGAFVLLSSNTDDSGTAAPTGTNQAVGLGPNGQPLATTTTGAPTTTVTTQLAVGTRNPFKDPHATTTTTTSAAATGGTGTTTSSTTTTTTPWWRTTTTTHRSTTTTTRRTRTTTTTRPTTTAPTSTTTSATTTSSSTTTTTTAAGVTLFSFEDGIEGFAAQNAPSSATVATQTDFHTDGGQGLRVATADSVGDWFGAAPAGGPVDLSGYTGLAFDILNPSTAFARTVFVKTGDDGDVCEGGDGEEIAAGSTPVTVSVPFADFDCGSATLDLTKVQQVGFWLNTGTIDVDNLRAQ